MSTEIVYLRGRVLRGALGRIDIEVDDRTVAIDVTDDLSTNMSLVAAAGAKPAIENEIGRVLEVWGTVVETQQLASGGYREASTSVPSRIRSRVTAFAPRPVPIISSARAGVLLAFALLAVASVVIDVPSILHNAAMYGLAVSLHAMHSHLLPPRPSTNDLRSMGVLLVHVALWIAFYTANLDGVPAWIRALPPATFIAWGVLGFSRRADQLQPLVALRAARYGAIHSNEPGAVTVLFDGGERRIAKSDVTILTPDPARSHPRVLVGDDAMFTSADDPRTDLARRIPWLRVTALLGPLVLVVLGFVSLARI